MRCFSCGSLIILPNNSRQVRASCMYFALSLE
jgi:DNA-directed RNA polymerase subunit N (RpoN/RPB10)